MNTRPHSIPTAAPAPPTMQVSHFDDQVTIVLSPALARDVAAIWAQAHAADDLLNETRPRWHDDVIALITNAALADQHAGTGPAPVEVPFLTLIAPTEDDVPQMQDEHAGTRCEDNADRVGDSGAWLCRICGRAVTRTQAVAR